MKMNADTYVARAANVRRALAEPEDRLSHQPTSCCAKTWGVNPVRSPMPSP